jgi:hypothetical protein
MIRSPVDTFSLEQVCERDRKADELVAQHITCVVAGAASEGAALSPTSGFGQLTPLARVLETGEAATMCNIAHREGTNLSYVARHINLTLLVPDIVSGILDKTLSEGVQLLSLATNPPMLWEDQRRWRAGMTG